VQLICPRCDAEYPIEEGIKDALARKAVVSALRLTPIGELLIAYISLFKPPKRALSTVRWAKLVQELVPMVKSGKIERNGRAWPAPQAYWQQAIEQMLATRDQLTLPLKTHGYLLTIISSYADKTESKAEQHTESRKVGGISRRDQEPVRSAKMPDEIKQKLNKFLNK
jgi:hypothetical protein